MSRLNRWRSAAGVPVAAVAALVVMNPGGQVVDGGHECPDEPGRAEPVVLHADGGLAEP